MKCKYSLCNLNRENKINTQFVKLNYSQIIIYSEAANINESKYFHLLNVLN